MYWESVVPMRYSCRYAVATLSKLVLLQVVVLFANNQMITFVV